MVTSDLWSDIELILGEMFIMIPKKAFAGLLVTLQLTFLNYLQSAANLFLHNFFDKDSIKVLLGLQL